MKYAGYISRLETLQYSKKTFKSALKELNTYRRLRYLKMEFHSFSDFPSISRANVRITCFCRGPLSLFWKSLQLFRAVEEEERHEDEGQRLLSDAGNGKRER